MRKGTIFVKFLFYMSINVEFSIELTCKETVGILSYPKKRKKTSVGPSPFVCNFLLTEHFL